MLAERIENALLVAYVFRDQLQSRAIVESQDLEIFDKASEVKEVSKSSKSRSKVAIDEIIKFAMPTAYWVHQRWSCRMINC